MTQVTVNARAFSGALAQTSVATLKDKKGSVSLQALQLRYSKTGLSLVATDTHRLHVAKLEGTGASAGELLIPSLEIKAIETALKTPVRSNRSITLSFDIDALLIGGKRVATIDTRAGYPNWGKVLASLIKKRGMSLSIERKPFLSLLEKLSPLALDHKENAVFMVGAPDGALYLGVDTVGGSLFLPIAGTAAAQGVAPFGFSINATFLRESVENLSGDNWAAHIAGPLSPLHITEGSFEAVIMPLQTKVPEMPATSAPATATRFAPKARAQAPKVEAPTPEAAPVVAPQNVPAPRVEIDATTPTEAPKPNPAPFPVSNRQQSRGELEDWARDYVASLVSRHPEAWAVLKKSFDYQISQLDTVPLAIWKQRAKLAFDAKVRDKVTA